LVEVRS